MPRSTRFALVVTLALSQPLVALTQELPPLPVEEPSGRRVLQSEEPETVRLTLRTDTPGATLQRHGRQAQLSYSGYVPPMFGPMSDAWDDVCAGSCHRTVTRASLYRIAGPNIEPSDDLVLPEGPELTVLTHAGNATAHSAGTMLTWLGAAAAVSGGVLLAGGLSNASWAPDPSSIAVAGAVFLGLGVAMEAIGIPLFVANRTTVQFVSDASAEPVAAR